MKRLTENFSGSLIQYIYSMKEIHYNKQECIKKNNYNEFLKEILRILFKNN